MVRRATAWVVAVLAVMTLGGCSSVSDFVHGFQRGFVRGAESNPKFHQGFRKGFQGSFLNSCEGGGMPDQRRKMYCTCAESELEKHFDDETLTGLSNGEATSDQKAQVQEIIRACHAKAFGL